MFGPLNSAYAFWHTVDTYISREISIGHPSVGLASLAQLKQSPDVRMNGDRGSIGALCI